MQSLEKKRRVKPESDSDSDDENKGLVNNTASSDAQPSKAASTAGFILQNVIALPFGLPVFRTDAQHVYSKLLRRIELLVRVLCPLIALALLILRAITVIAVEQAAGGKFRFFRVLPEVDAGMAVISPSTYSISAIFLFCATFWLCHMQSEDLLPRYPWARPRLATGIVCLALVETLIADWGMMHFKPDQQILSRMSVPAWLSGPEGNTLAQTLFFAAEWLVVLLSITSACLLGVVIRAWRTRGLQHLTPGTLSVFVMLVPCSAAVLPGEPASFATSFGITTLLLRVAAVILLATETRRGRLCCQSSSAEQCCRYNDNELPAVIITVLCGPCFVFVILILMLSTTMTFWYLFLALVVVFGDFTMFICRRLGAVPPLQLPLN